MLTSHLDWELESVGCRCFRTLHPRLLHCRCISLPSSPDLHPLHQLHSGGQARLLALAPHLASPGSDQRSLIGDTGLRVGVIHLDMGLSKVEVNLRSLLEAAPQQQNQAKLVHYITTARELLEQLGAEITPEGISSVSKANLSEYSEKIEALGAMLAAPAPENEHLVGSPISLSS